MSGNARTKRYRARLASGCRIAPVPYSDDVVDALIDLGWLAMSDSEDRAKVGDAISRMLADIVATSTIVSV
jgi:hypothetical protein